MAFNQQELDIIKFGQSEGKSKEEVQTALANFRTGNIANTIKDIPETGGYSWKDTIGDITETFKGVASSLNVGEEISEEFKAGVSGERNPILAGLDVAGTTVKGVSQAIGELPLGAAKVALPGGVEESIKTGFESGVEAAIDTEPIQSIIDTYNGLSDDGKQNVETTGEFALAILDVLGIKGSKLASKAIGTGFKKGGQALEKGATQFADNATTAATKATQLGGEALEKAKTASPFNKTTPLEELISPKVTLREGKKIMKEGRVEKGKESILFGKKKDIITPTKETLDAKALLVKEIPGVEQMDEFQIQNAIQALNTSKAQGLVPVFKSVAITPKETGAITSAWKTLKKQQGKNTDFVEFKPTLKSTQAKFNDLVEQLKQPIKGSDGKFRQRDLNDVWESRKTYDESITPAIKQADQFSSPAAQVQKELWLQNRRIFNDLLDDMSKGLNKESAKAFAEMKLLYKAENNLNQSSKIDLKGKSGIISPKNAVRTAVGGTAAGILLP